MAEKTFDKRQNTQSRLLSGTAKIVMYLFLIALVLLSIVPFYLVMVNATHSSFDIVTRCLVPALWRIMPPCRAM